MQLLLLRLLFRDPVLLCGQTSCMEFPSDGVSISLTRLSAVKSNGERREGDVTPDGMAILERLSAD